MAYNAKLISTVLLMGLVVSCGFQLRGSYQIPIYLKSICLNTPSENLLAKSLTKRLKQNSVAVDQPESCANLDIVNEHLDRRTLSLFPNGQVAEYELIYKVTFAVHLAPHPEQRYTIEILRDYQDNPNAVLAKNRERDLILQEMRIDAADRIVRQLSSVRFY